MNTSSRIFTSIFMFYLTGYLVCMLMIREFSDIVEPASLNGLTVYFYFTKYPVIFFVAFFGVIMLFEKKRKVISNRALYILGISAGLLSPLTLYFETFYIFGPWIVEGRIFPYYYGELWFYLLAISLALTFNYHCFLRGPETRE